MEGESRPGPAALRRRFGTRHILAKPPSSSNTSPVGRAPAVVVIIGVTRKRGRELLSAESREKERA